MKILVTGGCGYIGSRLIQKLATKGRFSTVLYAQWLGNRVTDAENVKVIKGDVRNLSSLKNKCFDVIIHLANIANDPAVDLNQTL